MNKQYFSNTKAFIKFITGMLEAVKEDKYTANDFHVYIDRENPEAVHAEWDYQSCESDAGFKWLEDDQVIMTRHEFPDGHYDYFFPEEVDEKVKEWHAAHPEWVMTDYGTWTNKEENRPFMISNLLDKFIAHESCPTTVNINTEFDVNIPVGVAKTEVYTNVIEGILRAAKEEAVLKRTDFLIFDASVFEGLFQKAKYFKKEEGFAYSNNTVKLGTATIEVIEKDIVEGDYGPVKYELPVYMDYRFPHKDDDLAPIDFAEGHVLFMADNGYVIGDETVTLHGNIPTFDIEDELEDVLNED